MPIHPWPHLLKRVKKAHPLLGLDVGAKTVGIAISDPAWRIATPLETLARTKVSEDMKRLAALYYERQAGGFVIGLSLHETGGESESSARVRLFARQMEEMGAFQTAPEISFYDERYSTASAESFLIEEADVNRATRDAVIDKLAAQIILQSALDEYNKA